VGSTLARRLLHDGLQVRGTHRREIPPAVAGVEWLHLPRLDDLPSWCDAVSGCEVIVHLAALAHQTGHVAGRWSEFRHVNVDLTAFLARMARESGVRRFVFVSSVAAVCSQSETVVDERSAPRPDSDYGRSKLEAEHALQQELQGAQCDWCIVRPPLVYGPGNPGNMARLMRLIERGLPLPVGAIHNRRSFIYIDNLVDALAAVVAHPAPVRSVYFLNDGSDFSTPELIRALAGAMHRRIRLVSVPVGMVRLLGRLGDLLGGRAGLDSYSVERLVGSMAVSGASFSRDFRWRPPVGRDAAIGITGGSA
jgi:nucleoside-diphosphate-sugar epimerase